MRPEKKIRVGPVSATVWKNESANGTYSTVQIERTYKDKENNWKNTGTLRIADLPRATLALQKAYEYLAISEPEPAVV